MNRDDIIRMAREANLWMTSDERIAAVERFAALVAAHEREACARVCEALGNDAEIDELICSALQQADETIRARGKEMPR